MLAVARDPPLPTCISGLSCPPIRWISSSIETTSSGVGSGPASWFVCEGAPGARVRAAAVCEGAIITVPPFSTLVHSISLYAMRWHWRGLEEQAGSSGTNC